MDDKEKKIRIAILCRGYDFDSWEADCIREVLSLPFVEIVLLIAEPAEVKQSNGIVNKLIHYPYRNFLWRYFKRYRLKISSYKQVSLKNELEKISLIYCNTELKGKYAQYFSAKDLTLIKSHKPDVILRFAYNIIKGEILTLAKHGVWSFHHADEQVIKGGPAGFWELSKRMAVTGAILQRLTEKLDAGIVLRKGFFPTIKHSYKANLEQLLSGTASWMKQALIDVVNDSKYSNSPTTSEAPLFTFPTNLQMFSVWRFTKIEKLKFHWQQLFRPEKWNIGFVEKNVSDIFTDELLQNIEWLPEPKRNEYYADPFGWEENGNLKIVFEHYNYKIQKGVLAISNSKGEMNTLLEAKVHLSYPFVLDRTDSVNNNRVILPESNQSKTVFCFDSANPKIGKVLVENIPAIDATPIFYNNRWWIFCTHEGNFNNTNLYIYHALEFEGPWHPHGNNPVKCDVRSSRPGGTPFLLNNKLYRPAQDCSSSYGSAVIINEVIELNENTFKEQATKRIVPHKSWRYNKGLHTLSIAGKFIIIDAKQYSFNFNNFITVLRKKQKRILNK